MKCIREHNKTEDRKKNFSEDETVGFEKHWKSTQ